MTWISRAAISRRTVTLLLAAALFGGGIVAWSSLKQELLPDVSFPVATVLAPYPGAAADEVAGQVVGPIERAVESVAGIDQVRSTSANSIGFVIAQFAYGTNVDEAVSSMEKSIATLSLPQGVSPQVSAFNINQAPVVIASISSATSSLTALSQVAATQIVPELEGITGVANVQVTGGLTGQVTITLNPAAIAQKGVSYGQIAAALGAANVTIPAGQLAVGDEAIPVTVISQIASIDALRQIVVGVDSAGGTPVPVHLADVAAVAQRQVAATGYGSLNGRQALGLSVSKTVSANTVQVADAVTAKLDAIASSGGSELKIDVVSNQADFIIESRDGLLREGGLGALFAILTIFAFLFSLRSTFVAALSIPLSLLIALVLMQFSAVTINIMTLGGLAVAVGRVVDDSIVVLENIYRHRAMGEDRLGAALHGPSEVAAAITSSTLTTVAVFLPLGFAGGLVSQFFLPFALTVTFALLGSLVVALTVIPVLGYFFVRAPRDEVDTSGEPRRSFWVRLYDPTIRFVLHSRWRSAGVVAAAFLLFVGSLAIVPLLPTQFLNSGSEKILTASLSPPAGTTSQAVRDRAQEAEKILLADGDVTLVQTTVPAEGDTGFQTLIAAQSGRAANSATMILRLDPKADLVAAAQRLEGDLAAVSVGGWDASVQQANGPGGGGGTVSLVVTGPDADTVESATQTVSSSLNGVDGLAGITSDLVAAAPQIVVRIDPGRAAAAGLSPAQVGGMVRGVLTPTTISKLEPASGGAPLEIVLRFDPSAVASVTTLQQLSVGPGVHLGDVADVTQQDVRATITRIDAAPAATVSAEITSEDTGAVSAAVAGRIDDLQASGALPAGVSVEIGGVSQQQAEAFGGLFTAMGVAIVLVYVMLVLAFNSLLTPFIILFSLPFATVGAFPALLLTGRAIGVSALIGFLMLIGIVVTNAIVLLDLVERHRGEGIPVREALIRGGHTRVRPILMTAIATILALVPLAAGFNEGSIIAAELGTVVIGGLLSSTFLTLIVVPAAYNLVNGRSPRDGAPTPGALAG
jgi:hydrophobic/amphiphilic exporter-1 (mainly G- bacteria), HAE1 family